MRLTEEQRRVVRLSGEARVLAPLVARSMNRHRQNGRLVSERALEAALFEALCAREEGQ